MTCSTWRLKLTRVATNTDLRALLIQTTNRLLIIIEDIDCSLHLTSDRGLASERLHKRCKLHTAAYDNTTRPTQTTTSSLGASSSARMAAS
jgi:hypothetical protein